MLKSVLIFDIETVPDIETGRKLLKLNHLHEDEVSEAMLTLRRQKSQGSEFMPLHLHKIVTISLVLRTKENFNVWSLGDTQSSEKEIIQRFFDGIAKYTPTLVSWNGSGFDLPVLHYRALYHGIQAKNYWEIGEEVSDFRWNNYLNRYHYRHLDLMDILACYQQRSYAPLNEIAIMLGLPGKMGLNGSQVAEAFKQGNIDQIRNYCEIDVLNTYLIYLKFELMRGKLSQTSYNSEFAVTKEWLLNSDKGHIKEFLQELGPV